jgi:hypothetical protein
MKRLKEKKKLCQNQEKQIILDEESTKILEGEICKKVEESLNTDEVNLEVNSNLKKDVRI